MNATLKDFKAGDQGRVLGFRAAGGAYRHKLLAMGLTPGVALEVIRVAPLGDPVEIRVRGTAVSLRRDEAAVLEVERI
ncbi:FeoA family protein [Thermochromatium tepidum]|jgi:Fe2+ transport system protein A|uniref:Ferrous iron transport protein A n=1 Tax=Thermochromatium tepidum ATCC 43061 TaxID=316276 RepID=A0A6I6EAI8_THETI|nr:FeoA family protein [Thermochromatium tepidum]QGU33618.1 ferrous iron transport protein A [Thermochromatium tepidum ATCC 43061]